MLDKAKAKSRKGKKSKAAKGANASTSRTDAPSADDHEHMYLHEDEYYQDELESKPEYYDDESGGVYQADVEWTPPHPISAPPMPDKVREPATDAGEGQSHATAST